MAVETFTKSGIKATTPLQLDKNIFGLKVGSHQLLKDSYLAYLANNRDNFAKTKKRGEVRGGGQKPWRQKGTGRARFGSSRNPIWTGGGVAFGPTGSENYGRRISTKAKRQALKQALSLAATEDRIKIIDAVEFTGKVKDTLTILNKIGATKNTLLVIADGSDVVTRSIRNIPNPRLRTKIAKYLNVYEVLNADTVVFEKKALTVVGEWLGDGRNND